MLRKLTLALCLCFAAQLSFGASINFPTITLPQALCRPIVIPDIEALFGNIGADGGTINFKIITLEGCTWTANADLDWLVISNTSGAGAATITVKISPNASSQERSGTVTIAGLKFTLAQSAQTACTFTLGGAAVELSGGGATATVQVSAPNGCHWSAAASTDWIRIVGESSGSGNGTISVLIGPNPFADGRAGALTVAGQVFPIRQNGSAQPCTYTLTGLELLSSAGQSSSVDIVAPPACSWVASSNVPWIVIASEASGTGNGRISFVLAPNSDSSPRTGTITIGGVDISIRQSGSADACVLAFPGSEELLASLLSEETVLKLAAIAPPQCSWAVSSQADWIQIPSGGGTGNGSIEIKTTANTSGVPRTGTITIGGHTLQITQPAAACEVGLSGTGGTGSGTIAVQAAADCHWEAGTPAAWIRITAGSGTGNGVVEYELTANLGTAERIGIITIGRGTIRIVQPAESPGFCAYTYSGAALVSSLSASGGSIPVTVTTLPQCPWTVAADADWLVIDSTLHTGTGTVEILIPPNSSGVVRTATLTIAGQKYAIQQSGDIPLPGCTYILDKPARISVDGSGTEITVGVTAPPGCPWKAELNSDWLQVNGQVNGSGSGVVTIAVAASPSGSPREGPLIVAGIMLTVWQGPKPVDPKAISIHDVVNAADSQLELLAPGGLCTINGANLGPADPVNGADPLQPVLAGVSIWLEKGDLVFPLLPTFVSAARITALVPFDAPPGEAQLTVTYNGTSAKTHVKIEATALGLYAFPDGRALAQNQLSDTERAPDGPGTPAKPGQVVTVSGTGLGAVNDPSAVEVTVGGKPAQGIRIGRSGCCTDEISFQVAADTPEGCYVPVRITAGGRMGNAVSISVTATGAACKDDANPLAELWASGKRTGLIFLTRSELTTTFPFFIPTPVTTTSDMAAAHFVEPGPNKPPLSFPPIGECAIYRTESGSGDPVPGPWKEIDGEQFGRELAAGDALTLTAPDGSIYSLPGNTKDGVTTGPYWASLGSTGAPGVPSKGPLVLNGGNFIISGPGGTDIQKFDAGIALPPPLFQWTNKENINAIDRSIALDVTWSGAGADHLAVIGGSVPDKDAMVGFACSARGEDGVFRIPASILEQLPKSTDRGVVSNLTVSAIASRKPVTFSAEGIDAGFVLPVSSVGKTVTYK